MAQSHGEGRLCRGGGRFRPCGVVSFINTRKLESWYSVLPFQAVMACLAQVEPVGQGWCKDATDLFRRLTSDHHLLVPHRQGAGQLAVELSTRLQLMDKQNLDMATMLQEKGWPRKVEVKEGKQSPIWSSFLLKEVRTVGTVWLKF